MTSGGSMAIKPRAAVLHPSRHYRPPARSFAMRHGTLFIALVLALGVAAPAAQAAGDISKVNSGIEVGDGESAGDLDTVNGGISVGNEATAGSVETVNGGVRIGSGSQIQSAETVNGGVTLGERVIVRESVEAVNGGISLGRSSAVAGNVSNVNGTIDLDDADVGGNLETVAGDITIGAGSHVSGGIKVEKPSGGWFNWGGNNNKQRPPRIIIGADAVVEGELVFEREVQLFVHESAKIGRVSGAEAKRYSGAPPL
jgi:DUF4097 and DUF4098 domain-containing protein YvlB